MLEAYYQETDPGYEFDVNNPILPPGISFSIYDSKDGNETLLSASPTYKLNDRAFSFDVDGALTLFNKELLVIFENVKVYDVGTIVPEDLPDKLFVRASLDVGESEDILFAGFKEVDVEAYIFQLD